MIEGVGSANIAGTVADHSRRLVARLRSRMAFRIARSNSFRRRFEEAVTNMSQGICLYDADDRLQLVNEQFCRIYNQPLGKLWVGMSFREMLVNSKASGNYPDRTAEEVWRDRKMFIDQRQPGTFLQELGDGRLITISHQPLADGGWVATYEDITERRRAEMQVEFMAQHDALTQLPNRLLFGKRLDAALAAAQDGQPCALICLDLDGFKLVNDRLGHAAGDLLLRAVAGRLLGGLRDGDIAARLGGDEFAVLLCPAGATIARRTAGRIGSALRQGYELEGFGPASIGVSIGVACAPDHAATPEALLSFADKALYRAKHARDDRSHDRSARSDAQARRVAIVPPAAAPEPAALQDGLGTLRAAGSLVGDLRTALQSGHLHLVYQAIYECSTGALVAYEALLRWNDPIRGSVAPADFIPAAEDSGFIVTLTEWVLRRACADAAGWAAPVRLAVNLSPLNFSQPDLVPTIAAILEETGLPASRLVAEVTAGVLPHPSAALRERIHALRLLGIELWLDDFGTGYANFATLAASPFSSIKIHRGFLAEGLHGRTILGAMITLGHTCGLKVVVEGLETAAQLELLRELGCDRVQGFLCGLPQTSEALEPAAPLPWAIKRD